MPGPASLAYVSVSSGGSNDMTTLTTKPIVFVVGGDITVRESLKALIEASGWQAGRSRQRRSFTRVRDPDADCTCSTCFCRLSGLDLQKRVAGDRPDMPVIFITGCGDVSMSVQAMKAGAIEFLTKPFRNDVLMDAVRQALERSRRALEHGAYRKALHESYASLTAREREVMVLVVSGLLNKQVGGDSESARLP
jgi:FixJ family two-component response regulator